MRFLALLWSLSLMVVIVTSATVEADREALPASQFTMMRRCQACQMLADAVVKYNNQEHEQVVAPENWNDVMDGLVKKAAAESQWMDFGSIGAKPGMHGVRGCYIPIDATVEFMGTPEDYMRAATELDRMKQFPDKGMLQVLTEIVGYTNWERLFENAYTEFRSSTLLLCSSVCDEPEKVQEEPVYTTILPMLQSNLQREKERRQEEAMKNEEEDEDEGGAQDPTETENEVDVYL